MPHHLADLPNLVIALGATASNAILRSDDADVITIYGPDGTLTGTIKISISPDADTATDTAMRRDLTSGGSDVTIASGDAVSIYKVACRSIWVYSSATETAVRTFRVVKQVET